MNIDSEKFNISTAKTRDMSFTYSNNNSGPTVIAQVESLDRFTLCMVQTTVISIP